MNTAKQNTKLNECGILPSSDVPTYEKVQKPIHIDTYVYDFNCETIRRNYPSVGCVKGKRFKVTVSVERLHVIHMTLEYCIGFSESEHTSEHKNNILRTGLSPH